MSGRRSADAVPASPVSRSTLPFFHPEILEDVRCELLTGLLHHGERYILTPVRLLEPTMSDVEDQTAPEAAVEVTDAPATGGKLSVEDALKQVLKNAMVRGARHHGALQGAS